MPDSTIVPNDLSSFWMPFTANRSFKKNPRLLASADRMHYKTPEGREILDGTAGLWCVNAGHKRPKIVEAIQRQAEELDFAPTFNMGHPKAFELANRLSNLAPDGLDHVMFTNSGSESVETALKTAIAYHRAKGEGQRFRLIGRERGYHGVNFGGISVGGIVANRKMFGTMLAGVDHMRHTHDPERNAFSKGQPEHGAEFADDLERILALHDPSTVAAVIVEPVSGSTGVLVPPKGYLKKLREICDKHNILLIFDEVITGYGRLGEPFAAQYFDVIPDMIVSAKGLTNGVLPMGAVYVKKHIHDAFMHGPEHLIEFFHGYTYSGIPCSVAAGLAMQEIFEKEDLINRSKEMSPYFLDSLFTLKDIDGITDIRGYGMMGGIDIKMDERLGKAGYACFKKLFEAGLSLKATGDCLIVAPPFICEKKHIDEIIEKLRTGISNYMHDR